MKAGEDRIPLELKFKQAEGICASTPENQLTLAKRMWDANYYPGAEFNRAVEDAKTYSLNQLNCAEEEFSKNKSPDKRFHVSDHCKQL